jgi:glycosyltransferase involved in cell wall biosynthesis
MNSNTPLGTGGGDGDASRLPSISVVIPTYNRARRMEATVRSALADPAIAEAIIVVDGSPDNSLEVLHRLAVDDHRVIPLAIPNKGQFRALAHGVAEASGDVVLLVDDDVHLRLGTAAGHARHHAGQVGLVVLGYMPVALDHPRRAHQFASYCYDRIYEGQCRHFLDDQATVLQSLWAGNFSMRREDFLRVDLSSMDSVNYYSQDRDFGLRCRDAGLTGVFDPNLIADHRHEQVMQAFLAEASRRALGDLRVHATHPEMLGPLDVSRYSSNLPRPLAFVIRGSGQLPRKATRRLWASAIWLTGLIRWWRAQDLCTELALRSIEIQTVLDAQSPRS